MKPKLIPNAPKAPITNPHLVEKIAKMQAENVPENRNAFINEMVKAVYLVPASVRITGATKLAGGELDGISMPQTQTTFAVLTSSDKRHFIAACTDAEELKKCPGMEQTKSGAVAMRFDDLVAFLEKSAPLDGFVVNPGSANIRIDRSTAANIKKEKDAFAKARQGAAVPHKIAPDSKVVFLDLSVMPDELLNAICEVLKSNTSVGAAYLQIMVINDTEKCYFLVLEAPANQSLAAAVANVARTHMPANNKMNLDISFSGTPLGNQMIHGGAEPFYTREKGRIYDLDEDDE